MPYYKGFNNVKNKANTAIYNPIVINIAIKVNIRAVLAKEIAWSLLPCNNNISTLEAYKTPTKLIGKLHKQQQEIIDTIIDSPKKGFTLWNVVVEFVWFDRGGEVDKVDWIAVEGDSSWDSSIDGPRCSKSEILDFLPIVHSSTCICFERKIISVTLFRLLFLYVNYCNLNVLLKRLLDVYWVTRILDCTNKHVNCLHRYFNISLHCYKQFMLVTNVRYINVSLFMNHNLHKYCSFLIQKNEKTNINY